MDLEDSAVGAGMTQLHGTLTTVASLTAAWILFCPMSLTGRHRTHGMCRFRSNRCGSNCAVSRNRTPLSFSWLRSPSLPSWSAQTCAIIVWGSVRTSGCVPVLTQPSFFARLRIAPSEIEYQAASSRLDIDPER
jgi:hypothetical protein